jgi:hypothetical protein
MATQSQVTETPESELPSDEVLEGGEVKVGVEGVEEPAAVLEEEFDFDSIVSELGDEDSKEGGEVEAPDLESPEFSKLAEDFKKALGVDLKQAYESFTQVSKQLEVAQQQLQEQQSRQTLADLQDAWDVTPKELDRRVDLVLKAFNKMSPAQKEKYDSLEGTQEIWKRIESSKAKAAPSTGGLKSRSGEKRYTNSEIIALRSNPAEYNKQIADIEKAFKEGRVDLDK